METAPGLGVRRFTLYSFRHSYIERMKDVIPYTRLAPMVRTSIAMLVRTYGKHSDESFRPIIAANMGHLLEGFALDERA